MHVHLRVETFCCETYARTSEPNKLLIRAACEEPFPIDISMHTKEICFLGFAHNCFPIVELLAYTGDLRFVRSFTKTPQKFIEINERIRKVKSSYPMI
ncbi:hypothetical protein TNCV_4381601 [Trichonephila clavipes]|nr:hypothetical protein TNCV_4381601 [Trichonephila clavipes]